MSFAVISIPIISIPILSILAWVVMSCTIVFTPRMGLMGTKSTPMMRDVSGIVFDATYN